MHVAEWRRRLRGFRAFWPEPAAMSIYILSGSRYAKSAWRREVEDVRLPVRFDRGLNPLFGLGLQQQPVRQKAGP